MEYVYVNGYRVPVLPRINADKIMGIKRGSIVIVTHDCYISNNVQRYLAAKDTKVIRCDK